MRVSRAIAVVAALSMGLLVAPLASAAPQPGDSCSSPGDKSPDGTLFCSGQSSTWMHNGGIVKAGQSCTRLGDVGYTYGEGVAACRQTDSGLVWVQTSRGNG